MREYDLQDTLVDAPSMAKAKTMARQFARLQAQEHNAKVEDYWAIDLETGEQSQ
jgi:hypothetical protein